MFNTYDMSALGTYLKNLRKNLNYTQAEVAKRGKINIETLRRIENGKVTPKYETIETLSIVYREDLMSAFSFYRHSKRLFELYEEIDNLIISNKITDLQKVEAKLSDIKSAKMEMMLVNIDDLRQLELFIEGIKDYYSEDYYSSIEKLTEAIKVSYVDFKIDAPVFPRMNMFESRILLLLSLCLTQNNDHEQAIEIMKLVLKLWIDSENFSTSSVQLITKLYFNISYNYYNCEDDLNTIKYTDKGIKLCKERNSIYCLYLLYYRRGIAKFKIGNRGYINDLKVCYQLLSIMGRNDLVQQFKKITKEQHGI